MSGDIAVQYRRLYGGGYEIRGFYSTLINCSTEVLQRNLSTNFVLIAVFVKVASEITKRLSIAFYPDSHVFVFFEIAQVYLRLARCREYKGHLQNE